MTEKKEVKLELNDPDLKISIKGDLEEKITKWEIKPELNNSDLSSNDESNIERKDYLSPFEIFKKCIKRASNIIDIHWKTTDVEEITDEDYGDCYRAAIVLIISALDGYVRTIIITHTKSILNSNTVKLSKELSKYLEEKLTSKKLLEIARWNSLMTEVEKFMVSDFDNKSFQWEYKIDSHFKMIGIDNIFEKVSMKININEKILRKDIAEFTKRRHYIAHTWDYDLTQTSQEFIIDKAFTENCLQTVYTFAENINIIIEEEKWTHI